jgi:hypothetical protein
LIGHGLFTADNRHETRSACAMSDTVQPNIIQDGAQQNHEATLDDAPKEFQLGVLLVHGMGTQPPRDTLVRWGDALTTLIGRATQDKVKPVASRASPGDRSGEKPAQVVVDFSGSRPKEKWLLAEGWWADSFPAPTYSELVSWSVRALPWSIALHIAQRYWQVQDDPTSSRTAKRIGVAKAIVQLLVALTLTPVFVALLAVTLLLGVLPIPQLRSLILSAQSILVGTVGDSLAFVESPLRAALIRTRILDGLERLQGCCDRTVIVAHSQGAAATLDALGGITTTGPEPRPEGPVPDTLVTFGSGVNQLVSLKVLSDGLPQKIKEIGSLNPVSLGVATVLVMIGSLLFLYASIRSGRITVQALLQAAGLLAALLVSISLLAWGADLIIKKLTSTEKGENIRLWTMVSLTVSAIVAFFIVGRIYTLPLGTVSFLVYPLLFLMASLIVSLSPTMATVVAAPVRTPGSLRRWVDLYASADPVPNGRMRIRDVESVSTGTDPVPVWNVEIWNRGSFLFDHTTYWENLDGFVLRIVRICAETAKSPWYDALPPEACASDERAAWRVRLLRWAKRLNALLWVFAVLPLWTRHRARVPVPLELPSWAPLEVQRLAVFVLLVAMASWATGALLSWVWSRWVRAEQRKVLAHAPPTGTPWTVLVGMGMLTSLLAVVVNALARVDVLTAGQPLDDPSDLVFGLLVGSFWGGVILAVLAHWLRPDVKSANTTVPLTEDQSRTLRV